MSMWTFSYVLMPFLLSGLTQKSYQHIMHNVYVCTENSTSLHILVYACFKHRLQQISVLCDWNLTNLNLRDFNLGLNQTSDPTKDLESNCPQIYGCIMVHSEQSPTLRLLIPALVCFTTSVFIALLTHLPYSFWIHFLLPIFTGNNF